MKKLNSLPTCLDYSNFLDRAMNRFKITRDEARHKYGQFTYDQWNKLLNN